MGSSSDLYIPRALAQEEAMQLALRHDLYVPDLCSMALSAAWSSNRKHSTLSAAAGGSGSATGSGSKRPSTSNSGSGASSSSSVPSLTYMDTRDWADVAAAIATTHPRLWQALPPDLASVATGTITLEVPTTRP